MPRMAPKQARSIVQRTASYAGWAGIALLMATLLYWLYLAGIEQSRDWKVTAGLAAGVLHVLYFLVGMGSVIVANLRSPEGKRTIRSAVLITTILAILAVSNVLAYRRHKQWDLTGNRRLTLSPMTKRLLKGLGQKVNVTAFYITSSSQRGEQQQAEQARDLLDQYADETPNLHYAIVDPRRDRAKWEEAKMTSYPPVTLVSVEGGGREEVKGTTEKDFTAALLKLTRKEKRKVYFTSGHGELSPDALNQQNAATVVKQVLADQQTEVATLDLMGKQEKVPADCTVLVIAGPSLPLKPEETKAVRDYLAGGGHALILLRAGGPSLADLLKDYGVKVGDDVIAQFYVSLATGGEVIRPELTIRKFESHDINRGLVSVVVPLARSLVAAGPSGGATVTPLLRTSADTVAKPIAAGQRQLDLKPAAADKKGPFTVALVAEKPAGAKKARLVVFGGASWADDMLADDPSTSNRYLFTNAVNWLADEDVLVDIPPKDTPPDQVFLTAEQKLRTLFINVLLFPVVCLFISIFTWWKRRS